MSSLVVPLLFGKQLFWETYNYVGRRREKPQLLSWKCPSLLSSESLPFCLASLIPAPRQQPPQHLPAPPSPCADAEPELLPSPFPPSYHIIGWELVGLCHCRSGKGMPGNLRVGIQGCLYGEMEGGWLGPHPWHRLLWECSLSQA